MLPAVALRPFVTSYYHVEVPAPGTSDWTHPEWGNVRLPLSGEWRWGMGEEPPRAEGASIFGPTSATARIETHGGVLLGIGLLPLGWAALVGLPADGFADRMTPLERAWPDAGALVKAAHAADAAGDAAVTAMLNAALLARLREPADAALIRRAHALLVEGELASVEALADTLAMHPRTFARFCARVFGFPPKPLLRRQRFLRTLDAIRREPERPIMAHVDRQYADQAHFAREFRAFMGMSATDYFARQRAILARAAAAREAALGAGVQGLHAPL